MQAQGRFEDIPTPAGSDDYFYAQENGQCVRVIDYERVKDCLSAIDPRPYSIFCSDEDTITQVTRVICSTLFLPMPVYTSPFMVLLAYQSEFKKHGARILDEFACPAVSDSFLVRYTLSMMRLYIMKVVKGDDATSEDYKRIDRAEKGYSLAMELICQETNSIAQDLSRDSTEANSMAILDALRDHTTKQIQCLERFIYQALDIGKNANIPLPALLSNGKRVPSADVQEETMKAVLRSMDQYTTLKEALYNARNRHAAEKAGLPYENIKLFPSIRDISYDRVRREGVWGFIPPVLAVAFHQQFYL